MKNFDCWVVTPTSGQCRTAFAFSLAQMAMYFNQVAVAPDTETQSLTFKMMEGTGVSANRETMVQEFLESDGTHLLFIDDDMGFHPAVLHQLVSRKVPIVGCNYRLRTPPARFMAWRDGFGVVETREQSTGIEEVTYMGFGLCLLERRALEEVPIPRFMINWTPEKGYSTEDSAFFAKCPYKPHIDHDASKVIWHNGNVAYTWKDDFSQINTLLR